MSIIAAGLGGAAAICTLLGQERKLPWLLYLGVSLTVLVAILQGVVASVASAESNQFQSDIRGLTLRSVEKSEKIETLQTNLLQRADTISELNRALGDKSDQLASYISGGDSFVSIEVRQEREGVEFHARQNGRYPVYDLHIDVSRIVPALFGGVMFGEATFGGSARRRLEIGRAEIPELGIRREMVVGREELGGTDAAEYSLLVRARNGWWQQEVSVSRQGTNWTIRPGRERKVVFR